MGMPGLAELAIVLVIGLLVIGVPVAILVCVIVLVRQRRGNDASQTISKLIEENQRLRDEITELKSRLN